MMLVGVDQPEAARAAAPPRPIGPWRRLRRRFYWLLAVNLVYLGSRLPLPIGRALGRRLARWGLRLRGREAERARANLLIAYPELASADRERLLMRSVRALGRNLFDTLAVSRLLERPGAVTWNRSVGASPARTPDRPDDGAGEGPQEILAELATAGRGVLILTGHLGCWELLGGWLARQTLAAGLGELGVVTGTIHNEPLDRLVQKRRRALGMKILPRERGVKPLLRHLDQGGVAAVLLDQNTRVPNLAVPFFGRPAPTPAGFAKIVLKRGVPVLPLAIAGTDGRADGHEVRHLDPILTEPDSRAATDPVAQQAFLARCNRALEELIRGNPSEWVWFHARWEEQ